MNSISSAGPLARPKVVCMTLQPLRLSCLFEMFWSSTCSPGVAVRSGPEGFAFTSDTLRQPSPTPSAFP